MNIERIDSNVNAIQMITHRRTLVTGGGGGGGGDN